jgi:hypothetical protein
MFAREHRDLTSASGSAEVPGYTPGMLWLWIACGRPDEWDVGEACWDGDHVRVHYGCLDACWDVADVTCWLYQTDDGIEASTEWELSRTDAHCGERCVDVFVTCERIVLRDDPEDLTLTYAGEVRALPDAGCDAP